METGLLIVVVGWAVVATALLVFVIKKLDKLAEASLLAENHWKQSLKELAESQQIRLNNLQDENATIVGELEASVLTVSDERDLMRKELDALKAVPVEAPKPAKSRTGSEFRRRAEQRLASGGV